MKSEIVRALVECAEGVHAFFIVLKVGRYTPHETKIVQQLLNMLKEDVLKHTVILFTHGEQLEGQTIEEFVKTNSELQELVGKCGGRCHVIDNKYWNDCDSGNKSNRVQVKNLLETIEENDCYSNELLKKLEEEIQEEMKKNEENLAPEEKREKAKDNVHRTFLSWVVEITKKALLGAFMGVCNAVVELVEAITKPIVGHHQQTRIMGCTSSVSVPKRKIVLLGKSGDGKSSSGNTILGENVFVTKASASNARVEFKKTEKKVHGRKITVIDTPGDFDTDCADEALKSETIKCLVDCAPGVDAFIIILKVGRYTPHENEMVQQLLNTFSEEHVLKHTVILFTHGGQLEGQTIKEFMEDCPQLQELVNKCGGRCHVIDNKYWNRRKRGNKSNRVQVKNLLETIDKMVEENGCYTNELLQKLEEEIQEEMKNMTKDNLDQEEQREKAKIIIHSNFLKCVGVTTRAVLGALFCMANAVVLVMSVLKLYVTLTTAFKAAGVGAAGVAAGVGAGAMAKGVLVAGGFVGAVGGIVSAWNAGDEAGSVCDVITNAAADTWENGLYMFKKAEEMCGLNSKIADLH
ncbi:GTPase IMAP family member 8-like [Siphateles boraxobius]|uniref:GTPase IMAP family member 8-like n=1 Tax=Siphateles boraxobius TaxID=180520 RepID=UPI004063C49F